MGTTIQMEEIETTIKFVPSDPTLPVELFLSIVEDSVQAMTDGEKISQTLCQIDTTSVEQETLDELSNQNDWESFKQMMVTHFKQAPTLLNLVEMLKSLSKGPAEGGRHFLFRVQHFTDLLKTPAEEVVDAHFLTRLLFVSGLSQEEAAETNLGANIETTELDVLAGMVNPEFKHVVIEHVVEGGEEITSDPVPAPPLAKRRMEDEEDRPSKKAKKTWGKSGKREVECAVCGMTVTRGEMDRHLRSHMAVRYGCTLCEAHFGTKKSIRTHVAKAHNEEMTDYREIIGSPVQTTTKDGRPSGPRGSGEETTKDVINKWVAEGLVEIKGSPAPNKPGSLFKKEGPHVGRPTCEICNVAFEVESDYQQHIALQHGGHKYSCNLCYGFTTKTKFGLQNHKLQEHNAVDEGVKAGFIFQHLIRNIAALKLTIERGH